jgi:hypothetical protein
MPIRSKRWCFTLNNYDEFDQDRLRDHDRLDVPYVIFGRESGDSGTPHLQGYIEFEERKTLQAAKAYISPRAHLERAKGSAADNKRYCSKDGDFEEFGTPSGGQGSRTDMESAADHLRRTGSLADTAQHFASQFIRYSRGFEKYQQLVMDLPRTGSVTVTVYTGTTGSGKTYRCHQQEPNLWVYGSAGWFDGYMGQEAALFDDFGGHEFKLTYLLKLLDVYPMRVPIKGGFVQWKPRRIYITSNKNWTEWYTNIIREHLDALERRLHIIVEFNATGTTRIKPL